jgi:Rrf2 family protein
MRLRKASRIGLYALVLMAQAPEAPVSAVAVAERFGVSENHVAKVLQLLARARLIESVRGPSGGYRLAKRPRDVSMLDVVAVLEGPVGPTCFACDASGEEAKACVATGDCPLRGVMQEVAEQVYYTFGSVTLEQLAKRGVPRAA